MNANQLPMQCDSETVAADSPLGVGEANTLGIAGFSTAFAGAFLSASLFAWLLHMQLGKEPSQGPNDLRPVLNFLVSGLQVLVFLIGAAACCTLNLVGFLMSLIGWTQSRSKVSASGIMLAGLASVPFAFTVWYFFQSPG